MPRLIASGAKTLKCPAGGARYGHVPTNVVSAARVVGVADRLTAIDVGVNAGAPTSAATETADPACAGVAVTSFDLASGGVAEGCAEVGDASVGTLVGAGGDDAAQAATKAAAREPPPKPRIIPRRDTRALGVPRSPSSTERDEAERETCRNGGTPLVRTATCTSPRPSGTACPPDGGRSR